MRTALCLAIGLAGVFGGVPASFAQDSRVADRGEPAGTGTRADERQTQDEKPDGLSAEVRAHTGAAVAVPIGRVLVGPEFVDGDVIYTRRAISGGLAIVEVSKTPFAPEYTGADVLVVRPDQPAGW